MFEKEPDLLTRKQCQNLLQINKSKMLDFIQNGYIPARKLAGSYHIKKSDLIYFVKNSIYLD